MPKKPPSWDQPTLFPFNADDRPKAPNPVNSPPKGDHHAVQDHSPRTSQRTDGVARATTADAPAPPNPGNLRARTEGQPRDLERDSRPGEAGQRPKPDSERGA